MHVESDSRISVTDRIGATAWAVGMLLLVVCLPSGSWGQDAEPPLYERDPFDVITLDAANESAQVEIFPITDVDRTQPVLDSQKSLFTIRRLQDPPDQLYQVSKRNIVRFEMFHERLLAKARDLIAAGSVDEAFPYLARLVNDFPQTPGIEEVVEEFYFTDARVLFEQNRFDESLRSLEEVYSRSPTRPGLQRVLQRVLGEVLRIEFEAGNFESVLRKIRYARSRFGETMVSLVAPWERRLQQAAAEHLALAKKAFQRGDALVALTESRAALRTWPATTEAEALQRSILAKYPRIRVGVSQKYQPTTTTSSPPPPRILHWAQRRAAPLLQRQLIEFAEFTAEGGRYVFPLGTVRITPDLRQIDLSLRSGHGSYGLCRGLLQAADPASSHYAPRWAEFLKSVFVPDAERLQIELTQPTLRPQGLLPRSLPADEEVADMFTGPFALQQGGSPEEQNFRLRHRYQAEVKGVTQIAERYYSDPSQLTDALIAGEIDVIDRVQPADVVRLRDHPEVVVVPYQIPTVHFLVFGDRETLLRNATFRRGLLYGIDRHQFLRNLCGDATDIAEAISAPLPPGKSNEDPLAYAYNRNIAPRDYDPSLSQILLRLAHVQKQMLTRATATPATQDVPEGDAAGPQLVDDLQWLPPLVIACPSSPLAQAACTAIAMDLRRLGFDVGVRQLADDAVLPTDDDWDMLYVEAAIQEPVVDFPDLVLGKNLLGRHGGLVWQATRTLQQATDLQSVREQFARIHKLCYDHTPLLPLWQVIEHAAYRRHVRGIKDSPVSLYDNIFDWQLAP